MAFPRLVAGSLLIDICIKPIVTIIVSSPQWLRFLKTFGNPNLDDGLARYSQAFRHLVQAMDHPHRKINIDAPLLLAGTPAPGDIEIF
jgi:hypothetical protein